MKLYRENNITVFDGEGTSKIYSKRSPLINVGICGDKSRYRLKNLDLTYCEYLPFTTKVTYAFRFFLWFFKKPSELDKIRERVCILEEKWKKK